MMGEGKAHHDTCKDKSIVVGTVKFHNASMQFGLQRQTLKKLCLRCSPRCMACTVNIFHCHAAAHPGCPSLPTSRDDTVEVTELLSLPMAPAEYAAGLRSSLANSREPTSPSSNPAG
jgi:hypothetical protein